MKKGTLAHTLTGHHLTLTQLRPLRFAGQTFGWERDKEMRARFPGIRGNGPYRWWRYLRRLTRKRSVAWEIRQADSHCPLGICRLNVEPFGDCLQLDVYLAERDRRDEWTAEILAILADDLFSRQVAWAFWTSIQASDRDSLDRHQALGFISEGEIRTGTPLPDGSMSSAIPMRLDRERYDEMRDEICRMSGAGWPT
ncbi:hypothetical protein ACKTEK_11660 [Tepidamorphus sp. 3E244]|uniref:hypothetical protein n=1 Tax=Tepidamorphus sp. 3E244 TaxID=3385498 RepID=UPI0038FD14A9